MARPLALTLGEPAGIGPDITIAAWRRRRELDLPPFYVVGSRDFMARRARAPRRGHRGDGMRAAAKRPSVFATALPVVEARPCPSPRRPAVPTLPARRRRSPPSISRSGTCFAGLADAVVTNPIAKNVLYRSGFSEPGHTEYLAKLAAQATGIRGAAGDDAVVAGARSRAGHHPSAAVARCRPRSMPTSIVETGRITARDLAARFGIARPRLAVAGLNPHAGEDGAMGEEDIAIVRPAVERLRAEGIAARGPLPGRHHVPRGGARRATTRRCACITTRR